MVKKYTAPKVSAKVDKLLRGLLRSPKSSMGLKAAALSEGVSAKFVEGWLVALTRSGEVLKYGEGVTATYQMDCGLTPPPAFALTYPEWLQPKRLPAVTGRHIHMKTMMGNS